MFCGFYHELIVYSDGLNHSLVRGWLIKLDITIYLPLDE